MQEISQILARVPEQLQPDVSGPSIVAQVPRFPQLARAARMLSGECAGCIVSPSRFVRSGSAVESRSA